MSKVDESAGSLDKAVERVMLSSEGASVLESSWAEGNFCGRKGRLRLKKEEPWTSVMGRGLGADAAAGARGMEEVCDGATLPVCRSTCILLHTLPLSFKRASPVAV